MLDEIIEEAKDLKYKFPFHEYAWNMFYALCRYANVNFSTDEMDKLRWTYTDMMEHDEEIPKILEDCRRLLA